jgi:hypothetical protein
VTLCHVCGSRTDAAICHRCTREISDALTGLTRDIADLVAVETRQASGPLGVRRDNRFGEREHPDREPFYVIGENMTELRGWEGWMYAPGAAVQLEAISNTVGTWARHVAESRRVELDLLDPSMLAGPVCAPHAHRRHDPGCSAAGGLACKHYHPDHAHRRAVKGCDDDCERLHCPHASCAAIRNQDPPPLPAVAWLLDHLDSIRMDEAAAVIHDELTGLAAENDRTILGRAGDDEFYGVCDVPDAGVRSDVDEQGRVMVELFRSERTCGAQLYGPKDAEKVRCQACGAVYETGERHATMRARLPGSLGTLAEVAGALTKLEEPVTVKALQHAMDRGLIPECGRDPQGHRLVRVGDVEAYLASRQRGKARAGREKVAG